MNITISHERIDAEFVIWLEHKYQGILAECKYLRVLYAVEETTIFKVFKSNKIVVNSEKMKALDDSEYLYMGYDNDSLPIAKLTCLGDMIVDLYQGILVKATLTLNPRESVMYIDLVKEFNKLD